MNSIKTKRSHAKGSLTRAAAFADSVNDSTDLSLLENRLSKLSETWSYFESLHNQLCEFCDEKDFIDPEPEFAEYELKYFLAHSLITNAIRKRTLPDPPQETSVEEKSANPNILSEPAQVSSTGQQASSPQTLPSCSHSSSINLPKATIPIFSGDYKDWPAFKDLFIASVDSNTSLTSSKKLQYLKYFLRGDAANLIKHMTCSENNYINAWDRLEARFDKTHLIVRSFIQSFLSLPTSSSGNIQTLRRITDGADEVIRGLNALESNSRDPWLIYLLIQKADQDTKQAWANEVGSRENVTIDELLEFLQSRCNSLESCYSLSRTTQSRSKIQVPVRSHIVESKQNCPKCHNDDHTLSQCKVFVSLDVESRRDFVKQHSLCFNCLRQGHNATKCRSNFRCRLCSARHHSLVHPTHNSSSEPTSLNLTRSSSHSSVDPPIVSNHSFESSRHLQTILPTAIVKVQDKQGSFQNIRLLLDTGSQVSFITEQTVQRLGLLRKRSRIPITGIASTSAGVTNGLVALKLQSRLSNNFVEIDCHVISKITSLLPTSLITNVNANKLFSIELADPQFDKPSSIDILVGSDKVFSIITGPAKSPEYGIPDSIPTIFGWVLAGNLLRFPHNTDGGLHTFSTQLDNTQEFDLEKFWRLEEVSNQPILSIEEQQAEDHFVNTHTRHSDGRYMVELPFKQNTDLNFGNSFTIAFERLRSMEKRFETNPDFRIQYSQFINEYLSLGHMEEISPNESILENTRCYYLPHHAVFKNDSSTTKMRVVFDGSAKTSTTKSLNECLLVGPTIQRDIFSVSLRFRRYKFTLSGDIEKMYRQIWISPHHTDFQRIVWRATPDSQLKHFRLLTITYGTSSAPFSAIRTLKQLALDSNLTHPLASQIVHNDFYVDDLATGADTIEELMKLKTEVVDLLTSAGFLLRKWTTNCWPLLLSLPEDEREISPIKFEEFNSVKILGLIWCPYSDCFSYRVRVDTKLNVTKRRILSEASRIFDPIGFLAPVIVGVKIILQELWKKGLNWDERIPDELANRWKSIHQDLHHLEALHIPRILWSNKQQWELHAFCDASLDAYAAVIYCRSINTDNTISVSLVAAKSKVAPIKVISLPRLELCGAVLLTRLINKIKISLQAKEAIIFAWTDSAIVLHWLSSPPKRWSVFIGNRTSEILSSLPCKVWNHVRSVYNPADIATRGILPSHLSSNELWWKGPQWLWLDRNQWPISNKHTGEIPSEFLEERTTQKTKVFLSNVETNNLFDVLLHNSSSWLKCIRVVAYILRFVSNCRSVFKLRNLQSLTTQELLNSKTILLKSAQCSLFSFEIDIIKKNKCLPKRNKLISLCPFLDSLGVLRVGGRLQESSLAYNEKHPIILCKSHPVSKLIVKYTHKRYLHAGVTLTFSLIKQNFYILGCRNIVRKTVHECVVCFRQRVSYSHQLMGNLPSERIRFSRPFSKVGCDYAGPITLRLSRGRNPKFIKAYIALFVCFVTKGIHLELVGDLSSNAFLLALDRFVARRGKPVEIWSDNGTNFHGAKRILGEMFDLLRSQCHNNIVLDHLSKDHIAWKFIPPSAPHFGGLWEAGVKSVKTHLKRVIGDNKLTYEEMYTLLTSIEALLNSRPMWHISDGEPSALTPAHFMIGEPYTAIPQPQVLDGNISIKTNYYALQILLQGFWKRWHQEYLTSLQHRPKWQSTQANLRIDDIVLLKEPNLPPAKWILGRVLQIYPGKDNNVRVVTIRTKFGNYTRPITKVAPLPLAERPESFRGG